MNAHKKQGSIPIPILIALVIGVFYLTFIFIRNSKTSKETLKPFFDAVNKASNRLNVSTLMNPLTGELLPEEKAKDWINLRPIAVMMNNHIFARPMSGISEADVVYEIVAEGGITRFLAFFLSSSPEKVGTIRSTREYYLVLVKEIGDAMLMHIGYSPQALSAIETWPVRSLGRLGLNCDQVLNDPKGENCWRNLKRVDSDVPWEHTAYGNIKELRKEGEESGWGGNREIKPWEFKDDSAPPANVAECLIGECRPITIDFWYRGDYTASFSYDKSTNTYLRYTGFEDAENTKPAPTIDENTGEQVRIKNVVVQFVHEEPIAGDEKNRLSYRLEGSGQALVFIDGQVTKATWNKAGRDERTLFYDLNGQPIKFNRGKFWISIVSDEKVDNVLY
jgi:hypothetical protein